MQKKAKTQDYLKPSAKTGVQNYLMIASNLSAKRKHDIKAFMAITKLCRKAPGFSHGDERHIAVMI